MDSANSYEDARRADAYAQLEFPGTYYLAYRDLPKLIGEHIAGHRALDFGCGTDRSTRFLKKLGFAVVGIDIVGDMIARARGRDPEGDYRLVGDGDLSSLKGDRFDLVLSAFTFDNIPVRATKVGLLTQLRHLLTRGGVIVNLVSSPEIYVHEWVSFSTKDFPENKSAKSGDKVRIIITDIADGRPVEDTVWSDAAYREVYAEAALMVAAVHRPLARADEPFAWVNETRIPPWVVYVLRRWHGHPGRGSHGLEARATSF